MDFKTFFEQNKKACVGGLAGVVVVLMGLAAVTGKSNGTDPAIETTAAATTAETKETAAAKAKEEAKTFYGKLKNGQPVSVLVLGDGFAKGSNLENVSTSWAELISEKIQKEFSSDVQIDNYALPSDNTVYSGFVMANEIPEGSEYDAVILSFGEYDDPETFGTFYESIIRNLIKKCPEISIISLIEPSSLTNPEGHAAANASAIQTITDHYHGLTIDVAKLMEASGADAKDTAASDNIGQNDEGNAKTADMILASVKDFAAGADDNIDNSVDALDEKIEGLESYAYISASDFVKVNDTTYELPADMILDVYGETVTGLMGVDYDYQSGANDVYVSVDGKPFGRSTTDFSGKDPEQHIVLINDEFAPAEYVAVSFGTAEEAASFAGIIVSGNITLPDSYDKFESKTIETLDAAALSELMDNGDTADGGPGSENESEEAEETEAANGLSNGATKTEDGVLYEYYNGEWYEVINDDTGNPDVGVKQQIVETRSAGQIITNKETVHSSGIDSSNTVSETQAAVQETVAETSAAIPDTSAQTAAETAVPETAAAEIPMETQSVESAAMDMPMDPAAAMAITQ
ncbi:SGNH/GDSL hydrolase family protein [Oribacterium sp. P6A1]|uniref:SGNH/GDSL hydrolase family protein n=1 Tax=Oribacterium sp. P6A1 TaxID=1410612 RepID=UPI000561E1E5|nr:SGNH/GDSL hydrolase family protein [Oribacterium sp. P6A1]